MGTFQQEECQQSPNLCLQRKRFLKNRPGKASPASPRPLIYKLPRVAADLAEYICNKSLIAVLECVSVGCVDARLKSSKFASPSENILQLCAPRAVRRAANWLRMKAKVQNYLQSPLS